MVEQVAGMTLDDFIRLYAEDGPFELVDGERIKLSPNVIKHNLIDKRLLAALLNIESATHEVEVFYETPFVLTFTPGWVAGSRVPDIMIVTSKRMEVYRGENPSWEAMPLVLVPDLVVEIISPTDQYTNVVMKANRYLNDGVKLVWVVDPSAQIVTVYHAGSAQQTQLTAGDTLEGGDLLPGFTLPLPALFA